MYIVSKLIQILVLLLQFSSELIDIGLNQYFFCNDDGNNDQVRTEL